MLPPDWRRQRAVAKVPAGGQARLHVRFERTRCSCFWMRTLRCSSARATLPGRRACGGSALARGAVHTVQGSAHAGEAIDRARPEPASRGCALRSRAVLRSRRGPTSQCAGIARSLRSKWAAHASRTWELARRSSMMQSHASGRATSSISSWARALGGGVRCAENRCCAMLGCCIGKTARGRKTACETHVPICSCATLRREPRASMHRTRSKVGDRFQESVYWAIR